MPDCQHFHFQLIFIIIQSMEGGICEPLRPFDFYSLQEFEYVQLLSRSKYMVGIYNHKQTKINYVIKQVYYSDHILQLLKKIDKIKHNNITPLLGLSLFRSHSGWSQGQQRLKTQMQKQSKENVSLLLFMEKYEMNLHQYVDFRRKKNEHFRKQQVSNFISQMLSVLQKLQREGLAHRDIKPQNILYHKGTYLLCDFDDCVEVNDKEKPIAELTTVEYSSPEFLRYMRHHKEKYFDPFKLDLYSFGLTLLFICSMGRFSLEERRNYIYEASQRSHADFIKQQRRKWITKNSNYKSFNSLLKMMLQEDEYKRDDFITLNIKIKDKDQYDKAYSDYKSEDRSTNSKSSANLTNKKMKKMMKARKEDLLKGREFKVYGCLSVVMLIIFILLCVL